MGFQKVSFQEIKGQLSLRERSGFAQRFLSRSFPTCYKPDKNN
ncbi:hypothetical protein HMPREF3226_02457 [Prevotella corporis]|uniref:Uncharacterized protein n=1 Tax=Prevotella corporis TaxID=28128 RepID=A0A133PVP9_9BACT|nr:hypothetical protein HMPREF3226_02457 [Prevotella corporis]